MARRIVCIVGPTASGKTALSIELALRFNGEIVSADSMQIYKGMDIGTGKPDLAERRGVAHHMFDVAEPGEIYSVVRYVNEASLCIEDILGRGKLPFLVGGTGVYVDSLIGNMDFAGGERDEAFREELTRILENQGLSALYKMLQETDPESAARIHENDQKRIIRALEINSQTGMTLREYNERAAKTAPRYDAIMLGLMTETREQLYKRIERRVDQMMSIGLLKEVERFYRAGKLTQTALQAIGYKEFLPYFEKKQSLNEVAGEIKKNTRRYAKRQLTWFRRNKEIQWLHFSDDPGAFPEIVERGAEHLKEAGIAKA